MEKTNVVVIGGGVVGLAAVAEIARHYEDVFLLEAAPRLGLGTSTRNSGVIHAGLYYVPGSLKGVHCVRGAQMLYEFCAKHHVPHQRIGKFVVAENVDQYSDLNAVKTCGERNGTEGLEIVESDFIRRHEPNVASPLALYSPNTGIVDTEELIKTLARIARENGAHLMTDTRLVGAEVKDGLCLLRTSHGEEVAARVVINAAGLYSDEVARMFGYDEYQIYPCRGEYAELVARLSDIVNHLIYPVPPADQGHGLGVHFTKNMAGRVLLGPNARYVNEDKEDYESDPTPLEVFYESAVKIVPSLQFEDLRPSYVGLRPRLYTGRGPSFTDFVITPDPNWPFVIHAIGIESPGLTGSLSIGEALAAMAQARLN
ncbi:MAG: NAD(P)/FAD-dependent oxidoreductase [Acidobacteria bacterium]|nr:NAD(P)/FAD-dependent oxidoreductase [Acidobacteriota bacterium]